ncbi:helix-turn-helix domain-containing protein [Cellulomonas hominis]|uniref:Helix-turn-helix domain-containing protein n=1 Tax=Cellulomonas hominis TaxID=156981 RepID=A0A7Z8K2T5_9CELL|nr:helix-turn-helix domain-containing protein [Cellulomonas hominis]TKR27145.1 helix-turn-helix domain-containing protein [Cellulomonas hominis]
MAARPWTTDEDTRLRELHAAGRTLGDTATEMGRGKGTISRHAARLGLGWDRAQTKDATKAKKLDAEARRAQLKLDLLDDAARLREQLWKPTKVFSFGGKDNTFNSRELPQPPHVDQLKLVQATSAAINAYGRLEQLDIAADTDDATSLLAQLGRALGIDDGTPAS